MVRTSYSLARVVYGYLYSCFYLDSLTGFILTDQLYRSYFWRYTNRIKAIYTNDKILQKMTRVVTSRSFCQVLQNLLSDHFRLFTIVLEFLIRTIRSSTSHRGVRGWDQSHGTAVAAAACINTCTRCSNWNLIYHHGLETTPLIYILWKWQEWASRACFAQLFQPKPKVPKCTEHVF